MYIEQCIRFKAQEMADNKVKRGQIWTVEMNSRRRPALVISPIERLKGCYVIPIVSREPILSVSLAVNEFRGTGFCACEVITLVSWQALAHCIGKVAADTQQRVDNTLVTLLGFHQTAQAMTDDKYRKGQVWHIDDRTAVLIVSSSEYHSKVHSDVIVLGISSQIENQGEATILMGPDKTGLTMDVVAVCDSIATLSIGSLKKLSGAIDESALSRIDMTLAKVLRLEGWV
jgi:mRNA-degrading endonuclease toxin of MazEF toxin-antitoxin module